MLLPFGRHYSKSSFFFCFRLVLLPFNFYSISRYYCQWLVADVTPLRLMLLPIVYMLYTYGWCYCHYCGRCYYHLICNIIMADVVAIWCGRCYNHWGWCYCLILNLYSGCVIANIVADVMATKYNVLADGIAKWQMEWPL